MEIHADDALELPQVLGPPNGGIELEEQEITDAVDTRTILKLISAGCSFFVAGVDDGSLSALIPYVIRAHNISTAIVSSVYGASFLGWLFAAATNTHLSQHLDLGAMLILGGVLQVIAQALRCWPTPFGLYVFTFWLTSLGQAYQDTHANTFVAGAPKGAHRWLGFIHAMYMAGSLVGPFAASPIASSGSSSPWYLFYTIPMGLGVANLVFAFIAFFDLVNLVYGFTGRTTGPESSTDTMEQNPGAVKLIKETFNQASFWYISVFFFFYLGATITAGGWIVEYLVDVRDGDLVTMGYVPAGFSGGCLLGRVLLPEPTHRLGEKLMIMIYCIACIGLQLLFWLVPDIIAASVAISLVGFFSGPLFATVSLSLDVTGNLQRFEAVSAPHQANGVVTGIRLCSDWWFVVPILTGLLSSRVGVWVLQPVLIGLLSATALSWLLVPRPKQSGNVELYQE